jgi:parallel beta-helix repeat protein
MPNPPHLTRLLGGLGALALLAAACADHTPPLDPDAADPLAAAGGPHVVHVAPPQGNPADDRASILAALEEVRPGGTVQFAAGTYVIGLLSPTFDYLPVTVPRITLLGHPEGTTLRGCDPEDMVAGNCVGLQLNGGHQTLRNFTFESFGQAVILGGAVPVEPVGTVGGYRIENNTFRSSTWGVRSFGQWMQPALVRNNTFVNLFRPVEVYGRTVHVVDNDISAPNWEQIPRFFVAWDAISFSTWDFFQSGPCDHNLAARNRVEGHAMGVFVWVASTEGCRHNVIRDNTIVNSQELLAFGIPAGAVWLENEFEAPELLAHTLVQGNQILGAEGVGIFVYRTVQNRLVNNTISDIVPAQSNPVWFGEGNGSGVWVSPESRDNRILNIRFADIAAEEVILEGDYNHVATRSARDVVRDLGTGNRITGPGSVITTAAALAAPSAAPAAHGQRASARRFAEGFVGRAAMMEGARQQR